MDKPTGQGRILIVDDDQALVNIVTEALENAGYISECSNGGRRSLEMIANEEYDLILLEPNLERASGYTIFSELRRRSRIPVIIITNRGEEIDRIVGLEMGADDYVTKPFNPRELVARVKNVMRRAYGTQITAAPARTFKCFGDLTIDSPGAEAHRGERRLQLTLTEFRLLDILSDHPGRVFSRAQLLHMIANVSNIVFDRTLDRHIANLRQKLDDRATQPRFIITVSGVGYKFIAQNDPP